MTIPEPLSLLVGEWTGSSTLWIDYFATPEDERRSTSRATVATVARGKFLAIAYSWHADEAPQDGPLLFGQEKRSGVVNAAWVDSWHMGDMPMFCTGALDSDGTVDVRGSYAAPPGPDWGWRTTITLAPDGSSFELTMYNVYPDGREALAYRNMYRRA